jgi:hypothetical protein
VRLQKLDIEVVTVLEDHWVKNYACSVNVLEANRACAHKPGPRHTTQQLFLESIHKVTLDECLVNAHWKPALPSKRSKKYDAFFARAGSGNLSNSRTKSRGDLWTWPSKMVEDA